MCGVADNAVVGFTKSALQVSQQRVLGFYFRNANSVAATLSQSLSVNFCDRCLAVQMDPARTSDRKARPHGSDKASGATDFHSIFAEVYGPRWAKLQHSLSQPTEHVALQNAFAIGADFGQTEWQASASLGVIKVVLVAVHLDLSCAR